MQYYIVEKAIQLGWSARLGHTLELLKVAGLRADHPAYQEVALLEASLLTGHMFLFSQSVDYDELFEAVRPLAVRRKKVAFQPVKKPASVVPPKLPPAEEMNLLARAELIDLAHRFGASVEDCRGRSVKQLRALIISLAEQVKIQNVPAKKPIRRFTPRL